MFKLYGGAMGGGKSRAICEEGLQLSLEFPGNFGVILRQTLPEVKATTLLTFQDEVLVGDRLKLKQSYNKAEQLYTLKNGSRILFTSADNDNIDKIKSMNLGWFAIDEATEVSLDIFLMLCTRLRRKDLNGHHFPYFGLLASNPEPGWVKEQFVDAKLENHVFIPALPNENPHLPENYIDRFKNFPIEWVNRYLKGSWSVFERQIFKEYDPDILLIAPFDEVLEGAKQRTIDYGEVNPTACLWGSFIKNKYDGEIDCFIYREFYQPGIVADTAPVIVAWSEGEKYEITYLDPMTKNRRGSSGRNIQKEFNEGLGVMTVPGTVSDNLKREAIHKWLKRDPNHKHPRTGQPGSPHLFIFHNLVALPAEMVEYKWRKPSAKELTLNLPEEAEDKNNHAIDALGWLLAPITDDDRSSVVERPKTHADYVREELSKIHQTLMGEDED